MTGGQVDDRLKRTVALLLAAGCVLFVVGLVVMFRDWPESSSYRVDGLNNGMPLTELESPATGPPLGLIAGGVAALGGVMTAMIGAVAIGVWLGRSDRGGDQG